MNQISELQEQLNRRKSQCLDIENRLEILKKIANVTNSTISNVIIQFSGRDSNSLSIVHRFDSTNLKAALIQILETKLKDATSEKTK